MTGEDALRWKPIPGYEGFYLISDVGTIIRTKQTRGAVAGRKMRFSLPRRILLPSIVSRRQTLPCFCPPNGGCNIFKITNFRRRSKPPEWRKNR